MRAMKPERGRARDEEPKPRDRDDDPPPPEPVMPLRNEDALRAKDGREA